MCGRGRHARIHKQTLETSVRNYCSIARLKSTVWHMARRHILPVCCWIVYNYGVACRKHVCMQCVLVFGIRRHVGPPLCFNHKPFGRYGRIVGGTTCVWHKLGVVMFDNIRNHTQPYIGIPARAQGTFSKISVYIPSLFPFSLLFHSPFTYF